jgi:hypothetical protein
MANIFPLNRSGCTGPHFCKKWRICERCAKIRAAQFADRAKDLEARHGKLIFARAKPEANNESAMRRLRDHVMRQKLAPAGLWSIESGELFAGLHLNILAPESVFKRGSPYIEYAEVVRSSARAVGAYMVKPSGMPPIEQYSGRLIGEWGTFTQMLMRSRDQSTITARAAMVERTLWQPWTHRGVTHFTKSLELVEVDEPVQQQEKTREEYAEIARRNLSNIYATIARCSQK